jgi:hypothetical protein
MNVQAVVCVRCGGPLARVERVPAVVECEYCGATISVSAGAAVVTREGVPDQAREVAVRSAGARFYDALVAALEGGQSPYEALRDTAAAHLGNAGQAEAVARVSIALGREFERDTGAPVFEQRVAFARIAQAYLKAVEELRTEPATEINLPFLAVVGGGPVHMTRRVTAAVLAEMAQRDPDAAAAGPPPPAPAPPPSPPPAEPPRKKRWWQRS